MTTTLQGLLIVFAALLAWSDGGGHCLDPGSGSLYTRPSRLREGMGYLLTPFLALFATLPPVFGQG